MPEGMLQNLQERIITCIRELQKMSGEEDIEISNKTCPIKELPNFDSLKGVVATVFIGSRLNLNIPAEGQGVNIFVSEDGKRANTIAEVAKTIEKLSLPS